MIDCHKYIDKCLDLDRQSSSAQLFRGNGITVSFIDCDTVVVKECLGHNNILHSRY